MEFNENHLREMTETAERAKSNTHRIEDIESDIKDLKEKNNTLYEMSASIKNLSEGIVDIKSDVKDIKNEQGEMKSEITELKNSPVKAKAGWVDSFGKLLFTAIATGIIAFVLGQLLPNMF